MRIVEDMGNTGRSTVGGNAPGPGRWTAPRSDGAILATVWGLGAGMVVAVRVRGEWAAYRELHHWCAVHGVPDSVRNVDSGILFVAAAFVGAALIAAGRGGTAAGWLRLRRGGAGWGWMVLVALLPMVVGGAVLGWHRAGAHGLLSAGWPALVVGVVQAPLAEESLFRGLLVGVGAAAVGWRGPRFWFNAIAAAILFASVHVSWHVQDIADGWPTLLVTGAGGLWYAWLLSRWQSLGVPMALHAGMNLGWMLAEADGGAGGGGWTENGLRAATIALVTAWTIRKTRDRPRPATEMAGRSF